VQGRSALQSLNPEYIYIFLTRSTVVLTAEW